jgi:hypothetical protein
MSDFIKVTRLSDGDATWYCRECGSEVKESHREVHSIWHEKLRMAVDETGTIG